MLNYINPNRNANNKQKSQIIYHQKKQQPESYSIKGSGSI